MKEYTLGFLFNEDLSKVVLIRKNRPEFQKGLLNGVGGKVEKDENAMECMVREFKEESGLVVNEWLTIGTFGDKDFLINVFASKGDITKCKSTTDEEIVIIDVASIAEIDTVKNVTSMLSHSVAKMFYWDNSPYKVALAI